MEKIEAFKCDYCNKIYKRSNDCIKHEKACKENPNNKHSCFNFCKHLIKETETSEDGEYLSIDFYCKVKNIQMYSYKLESPWRYGKLRIKSIIKNGGERMPLKCDRYLCKDLYEFFTVKNDDFLKPPQPCTYCPKYNICDETKK